MRYDYNFYHQHLRMIKREEKIRINELKNIIECIEAKKQYQETLHNVTKHRTDTSVWYWHSGYIAACNNMIELLKMCILDYKEEL